MNLNKKSPAGVVLTIPAGGGVYFKQRLKNQALLAEPNNSIFSRTVALMASAPGASSLRGSKPLPSRSLPASMYLRVASAKLSWHSVLTLILETPREMAS